MARTPVGDRPDVPAPAGRRAEVLAVAAELFEQHGYARTSVRQIADRAGILPGSLYHHVDSKEAVAVELIEAAQRDVEAVLAGVGDATDGGSIVALRSFNRAVAAVSDRHRAAVKLCIYDAPTGSSSRLTELVNGRPLGSEAAWRALVDGATSAGTLRVPPVEPAMLALALQQSAWVTGLLAGRSTARDVADTLSDILLRGVLVDGVAPIVGNGAPPVARVLDAAAERWAAHRWAAAGSGGPAGRRQVLLEVARAEFARRGFEATSMRDIAEAAGTGAASLYRYFPSKDDLLAEILSAFSTPLLESFREVVAVADGPRAAFDGLLGLMALASEQFGREYEIVKTWWRVVTPDTPDVALAEQRERFTLLRSVLADGIATGVVHPVADLDLLAVCVREVLWTPFHAMGADAGRVRRFFRETLGTGAAA